MHPGGRRARPLKKQPGGGDGAGRWDPTLWGSGLIAVAGLALALAWFIASAVVQAPEPPTCISYSETSVSHPPQTRALVPDPRSPSLVRTTRLQRPHGKRGASRLYPQVPSDSKTYSCKTQSVRIEV